MKRAVVVAFLAWPAVALAQESVAQRVYDDAKAIRRVVEVSRREIPRDALRRIVAEDIDLLRGKRGDGAYERAHYEPRDAGRKSDRVALRASKNKEDLRQLEATGDFTYRLIIGIPGRRLLVARNRRVYLDRVDLEYVPIGSTGRKAQTVRVDRWLEPNQERLIDLPEIARDARAIVHAKIDEKRGGPASVDLVFVQAKLVDNVDSPYLEAVQNTLLLERAIDERNASSIRSLTAAVAKSLAARGAAPGLLQPDATSRAAIAEAPGERQTMPPVEIYLELQAVEDLLTGNESERREGLDRLHQLVRRLRPSP